MIEILTTVYLVGASLSLVVLLWHVNRTKALLNSKSLRALNLNLELVQLYWSHTEGDFAELNSNSIEIDRRKAVKSAWLLGLLGLFGMAGFFFLALTVLSLNFLARSRKEIAVFSSALASDQQLSTDVIKALVTELRGKS